MLLEKISCNALLDKVRQPMSMSRRNVGALIIRIGFGGILCCSYNKEPPKIVEVIKNRILGGFLAIIPCYNIKLYTI